jgi:hypothetical protein
MNFLQRRRARFLIKRAQPFAEEVLLAVANITWVGNSMGAQPGVLGRGDWAGGLPEWTLIGAGGTRLFVIATERQRPDNGATLIGSWSLARVQLTEESYPRKAGPVPLGAWRAMRFEFPNRETSSARWGSVRKTYRCCGADSLIAPQAANVCSILAWFGHCARKPQRPLVLDEGLP